MGFLKSVGRTGKAMGVVKHDWPEYDEETPDVYNLGETQRIGHRLVPESAGILSVIGSGSLETLFMRLTE